MDWGFLEMCINTFMTIAYSSINPPSRFVYHSNFYYISICGNFVPSSLWLSERFLCCLAAPFLVLWLEKADFSCSLFLCLYVLAFLDCQLLQFLVWGKKKIQRTCYHVTPWVLRSLAGPPSSRHFAESFLVCFICNVQGCMFYLLEGIEKIMPTSSSQ